MTNRAWCPLPWMSVNVRNNGDLRVCCNANSGHDQGLVRKSDGSIYNLGVDKLHDFRNGSLMKDIRRTMLEGEYHPSCARCQREAESGMESRADWEREIWKNTITEESAKQITNSDGTIDINSNPIKYMDLRFGNLCNLKCRMCGPTDSNMWYEDTNSLWGPQYTDSGHKIKLIKNSKGKLEPDIDIYNWYNKEGFWDELEEQIPVLERLYIVGGEPLMIDQHYIFLQKCVDLDRAKDIIIEYNTNITNIPERAWKIWKKFKRVQIGMSVDAVGPINDYIRNPSKWYKIEENMRKLDAAEGNFKIWWAATIQAYNLIHLPEMMFWKIEQNFKRINQDHKPVLTPHPLHNPKFLNIKIFPKESKEWIENYFNTCKEEANTRIINDRERKFFNKILDTYVNYMWAEDFSDLLDKFWYYTKTLDANRKENLQNVSPKTFELLQGDKYI